MLMLMLLLLFLPFILNVKKKVLLPLPTEKSKSEVMRGEREGGAEINDACRVDERFKNRFH